MIESYLLIISLAVATFFIRLSGYLLGARMPSSGPWLRAFNALPGCLIAALLSVILVQGGFAEWTAAGVAIVVAIVSKNLPLTMIAGILAVWGMRSFV